MTEEMEEKSIENLLGLTVPQIYLLKVCIFSLSLNMSLNLIKSKFKYIIIYTYRFPRVFGDEFGDEFGDSIDFVSMLVTHLVMISVNHRIW